MRELGHKGVKKVAQHLKLVGGGTKTRSPSLNTEFTMGHWTETK